MTGCAEALGPACASQRSRSYYALRVALGAVVFTTVAALQLFRQSGAASWRTVWAEDGGTFYSGTTSVTQLLRPYAGYAVFSDRLLGLLAHLVPIEDLARYYAVAGALVTTLAALAVWHFARRLVRPWPLRLVLALSVAFLPTLLLEQMANGVNSLWAVLFAGWWALLYQPKSVKDALPGAAVACFAALSSGLALVYVPLVALLAVKRRDPPSRLVLGAYAIGGVVQGIVSLGATDHTPTVPSHVTDLPREYAVRVLGSALVGEQWLDSGWNKFGRLFALGAVVVVSALVVALIARSTGDRRCLGLITLAYSVGLYVVPVWIRGTETMRVPNGNYVSTGNRYASLSIWFLLSGLALLASGSRAPALRSVVAGVFCVQFLIVATFGFRMANPRSNGPEWAQTVSDARSACNDKRRADVTLEVIPAGRFPITVSCSELRE